MAELLRAPFPYAGGKGKKDVTALAWQAMGVDVPTYIEATTGSAAMLLARPGGAGKYEVINDANGLIVNVWRAIKAEPDLVAEMVQQPPSELELAARSRMLRGAHEFIDLMKDNIEWFDVACAAYWVWCQCVSFAPDWITQRNPPMAKPYRRGILSPRSEPKEWLQALAERLRKVSIAHGDWSRLVTPSALGFHNTGTTPTGIFFDPPYPDEDIDYGARPGVAREIEAWCRENGDDDRLRIVLCGHVGDYDLPGWNNVNWGGSRGWGRKNRGDNEALWLSPHCLQPAKAQSELFEVSA